MLHEACDPDSNFYNANVKKLDAPYISSEKFPSLRINTEQNEFSIFNLNARSIKRFFGIFKLFLSSLNFNFSVLCLLKTWLDEETIKAFIKLKIVVKAVEFQFI